MAHIIAVSIQRAKPPVPDIGGAMAILGVQIVDAL